MYFIFEELLVYYCHLMAWTTWVSWHQKSKPFWISWSKWWWGGSKISWTICRSSAPRSRQV